MKCVVCGKEVPEYFRFCDTCGAEMPSSVGGSASSAPQYAAPSSTNLYDPISQKFSAVFGKPALFVAAIFLAVYCGICLFVLGTVPVLQIIAAVAMFMLCAKARSNVDTSEYRTPLKMLSGVALAQYVIGWVSVGLSLLVGVTSVMLGSTAILLEFAEFSGDGIVGQFFAVFGVVFIIVAVVLIFINIFCYGKIRKCAKSFTVSCESRTWVVEKLGAVRGWFITFGIFQTASVLTSLSAIPSLYMLEEYLPEMLEIFDFGAQELVQEFVYADLFATASVGTVVLEIFSMICIAVVYFIIAACAREPQENQNNAFGA